jgi:hypothetical protein
MGYTYPASSRTGMGRWPKIDKLGTGTTADHEEERPVPAKCGGYGDVARGGGSSRERRRRAKRGGLKRGEAATPRVAAADGFSAWMPGETAAA